MRTPPYRFVTLFLRKLSPVSWFVFRERGGAWGRARHTNRIKFYANFSRRCKFLCHSNATQMMLCIKRKPAEVRRWHYNFFLSPSLRLLPSFIKIRLRSFFTTAKRRFFRGKATSKSFSCFHVCLINLLFIYSLTRDVDFMARKKAGF